MPTKGRKGTSSRNLREAEEEIAARDSSPSSWESSPSPQQMDLCALFKWMGSRDDVAPAEREEDAARRKAKEAAARAEREEQRRENFACSDALLSRLASPGVLSLPPPM